MMKWQKPEHCPVCKDLLEVSSDLEYKLWISCFDHVSITSTHYPGQLCEIERCYFFFDFQRFMIDHNGHLYIKNSATPHKIISSAFISTQTLEEAYEKLNNCLLFL